MGVTSRSIISFLKAWVAFGLLPACLPVVAHAQIKIQDIPLDFAVAAETKLQPFGSNEVATTTASVAVRNVQASIDGALPGLNSSLRCSPKNRTEITFRSISLQQTDAQNAPLIVSADVHLRECRGLYEGDELVSLPISVSYSAQAIALQADTLRVAPSGFRFVGLFPGPQSLFSAKTRKIVEPKLANLISILNGQVQRGLFTVKRWTAIYSVAIQSSQITIQNGDLVVTVQLSGQVPLTTANKWLQAF